MPNITLPLTDSQMTMLAWAAEVRQVTTSQLIADTLAEFLRPLEIRFRTSHRQEASTLFDQLSVDKQLEVLEVIRAAIPPSE